MEAPCWLYVPFKKPDIAAVWSPLHSHYLKLAFRKCVSVQVYLLMFLYMLLNSLAQFSKYLCSENRVRVGYIYPFFTEIVFSFSNFHIKLKLNFTGVYFLMKTSIT